jgi:hypothetical protein
MAMMASRFLDVKRSTGLVLTGSCCVTEQHTVRRDTFLSARLFYQHELHLNCFRIVLGITINEAVIGSAIRSLEFSILAAEMVVISLAWTLACLWKTQWFGVAKRWQDELNYSS